MALVAAGSTVGRLLDPGRGIGRHPTSTSQSEASADIVRPQRIVAITSETADMALLLAGPQSMAAQGPAVGLIARPWGWSPIWPDRSRPRAAPAG